MTIMIPKSLQAEVFGVTLLKVPVGTTSHKTIAPAHLIYSPL